MTNLNSIFSNLQNAYEAYRIAEGFENVQYGFARLSNVCLQYADAQNTTIPASEAKEYIDAVIMDSMDYECDFVEFHNALQEAITA